jgi:hypothetical protein
MAVVVAPIRVVVGRTYGSLSNVVIAIGMIMRGNCLRVVIGDRVSVSNCRHRHEDENQNPKYADPFFERLHERHYSFIFVKDNLIETPAWPR